MGAPLLAQRLAPRPAGSQLLLLLALLAVIAGPMAYVALTGRAAGRFLPGVAAAAAGGSVASQLPAGREAVNKQPCRSAGRRSLGKCPSVACRRGPASTDNPAAPAARLAAAAASCGTARARLGCIARGWHGRGAGARSCRACRRGRRGAACCSGGGSSSKGSSGSSGSRCRWRGGAGAA